MLEASKVSVHYRGGDAAALDGVSLRVDAGEIVSLVGANGSGKSTLGALLCAMRLPDTGSVTVDGADPARSAADRREMRRRVGLVRQHPFDQLVSTVVFDEVAFGPRNLGLDRDAVRARVDRALARVGLDGLERRDTTALSGGEQQRLALAGVLAMEPSYIVLDEASSMLDASARPRCRALVAELAASDIGIVQITHDPLEILSSRRVVVLDTGRVAFEGTPLDLLFDHADLWDGTIVSHPAVEALRYACGRGFHPSGTPTPQAAVSWLLEGYRASRIDRADIAHALTCCEGRVAGGVRRDACPENANPVIAIDGVSYSYDGRERVLRDVSLDLRAGEVALIAGTSGSGKSTLACIAAGLIASDAGTVAVCGAAPRPGDVGMAFQRPEDQLFCESVADELAFAPRNLGCDGEEVAARVRRAAGFVGLDDALMDRYPFELSGGQARRVAVGSVLSLDAAAYILDEPTAGLDAAGRAHMHVLARSLADAGCAVAIISHDLEEWLGVVDRVVFVRDGRIVWSGSAGSLHEDADAFDVAGLDAPLSFELARALKDALDGDRP